MGDDAPTSNTSEEVDADVLNSMSPQLQDKVETILQVTKTPSHVFNALG